MSRAVCLFLGGLIFASAMLPGVSAVEVKEKDVPKEVVKVVKDRYPNAKISEIDKDKEDGQVVYTFTLTQKGPNLDVTVTEKGVITHVEKEIAAKDLPKEVTKAVNDKYPKGTIELAGEVFVVKNGKDVLDVYDVIVKAADKKVWQLEVSPAGKIVKQEEIKEEK